MGLRVTVLPPPKGIGGILMQLANMGKSSGVLAPDSYLSPETVIINQKSLLVKFGPCPSILDKKNSFKMIRTILVTKYHT